MDQRDAVGAAGIPSGGVSRASRLDGLTLFYFAMATVLAVLFMFPWIWTLMSSLKTVPELYIYPPAWLPRAPQWDNYAEVFRQVSFGRFFVNSVITTVLAMLGQIAAASLVAYGFSRFRFPWREQLFIVLLSTLMLPAEVTLIPKFLLFKSLGWINTYLPLIVPLYFGGGPFFVFLFRQFFQTIPLDLDESAKLDGASSFRIFISILVPLCQPVIATASIFSFLSHWNNFIGPLIYLNDRRKYTLPIGLRYFQALPAEGGEPKEHLLMAASVLTIIPSIILFFSMQKYFVRGVVTSGIKG